MFDKYRLQSTSQRGQGWLRRLGKYQHVTGFDFVAPTPLEECVSRVGSLQELRTLDAWVPQTRVNLQHIDDHTYAFILREKEPAPVELRGYMNRLDDGSTYISGQGTAKIYLQASEFLFLVGLVVFLSFVINLFVAVLFLPLLGGFGWFYWRGARQERNRLIAVLKDTLTY